MKVSAQEINPLRAPFISLVKDEMRAQNISIETLAAKIGVAPRALRELLAAKDLWLSDLVVLARELKLTIKLKVKRIS